MPASAFTHNFLLMFSAPIVWAVHFVAMYGFTGILCARPWLNVEWLGLKVSAWGVLGMSLVAILAIALLYFKVTPKHVVEDNRVFLRWMSGTLSLLSILAIVWEALPVFIVPACR